MSSWKVITFDTVAERRDFGPEHAEAERDFNPNWEYYLNQFDGGYDNPDFEFPTDRLQRVLAEEHSAETDRMRHIVYALVSDDTNCESILDATAQCWDRACIIRANDTSDIGTVRIYSRLPDSPDAGPIEGYEQIDEFEESQSRDGARVGDKAAAYVSFNYGFTARARTPLGKGWDSMRALNHEVRYRIVVDDPTTTVGDDRLKHGYERTVENGFFETDVLYKCESSAEEKASIIERQIGLDAQVEPVPVKVRRATDEVEEVFDPTRYPAYEPMLTEEEVEEQEYQSY